MTAQLLEGKPAAEQMKAEIYAEVAAFKDRHGFAPALAVVLVGEDPASKVYVKRISKSFADAGMGCSEVVLRADITPERLQAEIVALNGDPTVSGIIVQLPLPAPLTEKMVTDVLSPEKDVDGITPMNAGLLMQGLPCFVPNTPAGGLELLKRNGIEIKGKNAVIVGRSNIVGKPMAMLLLHEHATITVCHSRTRDLAGVCRQADILCAAIGKANMITGDMIKPGAAVVDFGINPQEKGIVGDVEFSSAKEVAGWITPVPGGTGVMTNVMLLANTLSAAKRALEK